MLLEIRMHSTITSLLVFLGLSLQPTGVFGCAGNAEPWFAGNCFSWTNNMRFDDAAKACTAQGTLLTSIRNAEENEAIRKALINSRVADAWIGLDYDRKKEKFFWLDGTPLNYTNFGDTSCTPQSDCRFVMHAYTGKWNAERSYGYYNYGVCRNARPNDLACDDYDFVTNSSDCVRLFEQTASWTKAEHFCIADHAHLIAIHDQEMNDYISAKAFNTSLTAGIHIGMKTDVRSKQMNWTDGSAVVYTNFAQGFPMDLFGHCTAMETNAMRGKWASNQCDSSPLPYACSRPAYNSSNPMAPPGCPPSPYFFNATTVYSPSYPGAPGKLSCDYFFALPEDQHVRVIFDDFELNVCCDKLELFDGAFSATPMATLTGQVDAGKTYDTKSNIAKLTLTTTDGERVRGFRVHFY